jgi:hypothetical protein
LNRTAVAAEQPLLSGRHCEEPTPYVAIPTAATALAAWEAFRRLALVAFVEEQIVRRPVLIEPRA